MQPAPLHLLLGPEEGRKQEFLAGILKNIEKREGQSPERTSMYAGENGIGDAIALLRNGSLFHPYKVVLFHGAEAIKTADDHALLARYAQAPSQVGTLILLSQETRVSRKIESAVPKSQIKIFWELFENQKEQFVQGYMRQNGRTIDRDALEMLLETVDNSTDQLRSACDRLLSLFPKGTSITEEHVETFMFHSKQESVFTLFHAVGKRDLEQSLEILHTLLDLQDMKPFQIVAGVSWQLRRLLSVKERLQRGQSPDEVWTVLKVRGKRNQEQMLRAARVYSLPELQERVRMAADADTALRSDRSGIHAHLMNMFILRLVLGNQTPQRE
ncbi:MAG: DNA polymerase III subunit delta [Spirochaeta sp.]